MKFRSLSLSLLALAVAAIPARGQGLMMPREADKGPIALLSHRVNVTIDNHVAETRVEQVFVNNGPSALDADYLFPLPKDAAVGDFTLTVNGNKLKGEIAEKEAARAEYMKLVGRTRNPGLLEYMDRGLMRIAVAGLEPGKEQKVEIRFTQVLSLERGLARYELPLRTTGAVSAVQKDFTVGVKIVSPVALSTVYSPSHTVKVRRPNANEAVLGFEKDQAHLDRDFQLYYSVTDKEFGLNLVTYRPDPSKPGWFLCLISPKSEVNTAKIVKRDVVFVLDISGSMRGEKLKQAKAALKYCVNRLNEGDRFALIEFDNAVRKWNDELLPANRDNLDKALQHIDGIVDRGGTNINDALVAALSFKREEGRPGMVVFLTDGLPSAGERNPQSIIRNVTAAAKGMKVFSFGVGYDVNTHLLDTISAESNAASDYVKPGEDTELKISQFYSKASRPVLADLKLDIDGSAKVAEVYPKRLPDMFAGSQIVVSGRFEGTGPAKITLTGNVNGKVETFTYDVSLPEKSADHKFVEPLWAQRKIGYILDALRTQDNEELRNEVIRLSKLYGIQTPYTSYIAREQAAFAGAAPARDGRYRGAAGPGVNANRPADLGGAKGGAGATDADKRPTSGVAADPAAKPAPAAPRLELLEKLADQQRKQDRADDSKGQAAGRPNNAGEAKAEELARSLQNGLRASSGKDAVHVAGYLKKLKEAEGGAGSTDADARTVAGVNLYRYNGVWVDERFNGEAELTQVKFGSDAYFALLSAKPEWTEIFKLGSAIILITAEGRALVIGAEGAEKLSDEQLKTLFTAAPKKVEQPKVEEPKK